MKVRLDVIELDPENPKQEERIKRIANSIKEIGQIEPVKLRTLPNKRFAMVSGHHRYWALKSLRRKTIDADIEGMSEDTMRVQRSVAAAFKNREDPDIVKAQKMINKLEIDMSASEEEVRRLANEYGYKPNTIKHMLAFGRFADQYCQDWVTTLWTIGITHYNKTSALHEYPDKRADLLREVAQSGNSAKQAQSKAKAILKKIEEAEEAKKREELEIAKRREREAERIRTMKAADEKGKVKEPETLAAQAEHEVRQELKEETKKKDWTQHPSSKQVLDGIMAIYKKSVPTWRQVVEMGKFPPEANNKLVELLDKAIESLSQFREELSNG